MVNQAVYENKIQASCLLVPVCSSIELQQRCTFSWLPFPIGQMRSQVWCRPYLETYCGFFDLQTLPWLLSPSKYIYPPSPPTHTHSKKKFLQAAQTLNTINMRLKSVDYCVTILAVYWTMYENALKIAINAPC